LSLNRLRDAHNIGGGRSEGMPGVPRMLRNAARLRRGALLIRGPGYSSESGIPDLRSGMSAMLRIA
jgi:hypothetical protein